MPSRLSFAALPRLDRADSQDLHGAVVDVWLLDLPASEKDADRYRRLLNQEERQREERYRVAHARRAFLLTRGRLRELLGEYLGVAPALISLAINDHGKPRLEGTAESGGLVFSVSHTKDLAVLAFARDTALGVDAETTRVLHDLDGVARQCLSENELNRLREVPDELRPDEFIRYWVCKEAFVKATGRGIALGLDRVGVRADFAGFEQVPSPYQPAELWRLHQWEAGTHRFAVAYSGMQREIRFRA